MGIVQDQPSWRIRILLVEDIPPDTSQIRRVLADYQGADFEVEQVRSVEAALGLLIERRFDAMLLDVSLPEGHGLTAFLRAKEAAPTIPVVVLADEDDESLALDAISLGAQDHLVKSDARFLPRTVLSAIHRHGVLSDLRSAKQREHFLATHDSLSGLLNRYAFIERLNDSIARAERSDIRLGVLFVDLDDFKAINDTLGHTIGDEILRALGRRLEGITRATDTVARWGGDEFTILIHEVKGEENVVVLARRLLELVEEPFLLAGKEYRIGMSIGIAVFPDDGRDCETLVRNADTAMYQAKARGQNRYYFFSKGMNASAAERLRVGNSLRQAIAGKEILVHYQPQVDLATGEIVTVEALARWRDESGGLASARDFVPAAERLGLVTELGELVLRQACTDAVRWERDLGRPIRVAVNVSPYQLNDQRFLDVVEQTLQDAGLDPSRLELEITETVTMDGSHVALRNLRELRKRGIGILLDDFGTGFATLHALKTLPIDSIKIDRSFVENVDTHPVDAAIIAAVGMVAASVGCGIIAEGVERPEQVPALYRIGCTRMQGYLFGEPMPTDKLEVLLREDEFPWVDLVAGIRCGVDEGPR
jgi:diguanylate cyclase (GGDEF)-like protein